MRPAMLSGNEEPRTLRELENQIHRVKVLPTPVAQYCGDTDVRMAGPPHLPLEHGRSSVAHHTCKAEADAAAPQ